MTYTTRPSIGEDDELSNDNPHWHALVDERGIVVALGRAHIMEACAEALNAKPDDWDGEV